MEDTIYGVHQHQHHGHGQPSASAMHDDDLHALIASIPARRPAPSAPYGSSSAATAGGNGAGVCNTTIKAKIASHPRYSRLLDAYIDCQKVGAPQEVASLLEEIRRENCDPSSRNAASGLVLGADPELDLFMDTYCEVLAKYKADLARPFDEATSFFNSMKLQLTDICKSTAAMASAADEAEGSTEEEQSGGEMDIHESHPREEDKDIKEKLLRKYSGYLSNLKQEFSKKKKKGKLPKEARQTLLDWWNVHYKWPYPTEADKIALAELTGLDQKQINNWFINQRKRHWKPSESMQYAVMDSLSAPYFG